MTYSFVDRSGTHFNPAVTLLFIVMSLFSCSKEQKAKNITKRMEGNWQMVSRKVDGQQIFRVMRINHEDSLITQCGDTIHFQETSTLQNDTLSFSSGGTLSHSSDVSKTELNYTKSYENCIETDTSFSNYFNTKSANARNYPKDIEWEINYNDNSGEMHLTIIEPWKLYMASGEEVWYNYTYQYEIITLNRNELIIKGVDYPCFFGYVTTDEEIQFKRIR